LADSPLKILFLAEGQLGDSIVLGPALKAMKMKYPECETSILLMHRRRYHKDHEKNGSDLPLIEKSNYAGTAEVFLDHPYADNILELDRKALRKLKGLKRLKAEMNCIKYIRKQKFNAAVCTFPQERFITWSFFAGIKKRIGEKNQKMSWLLTDKPDISRKDGGVLKYFCDLLSPLGVKCASYDTYYEIPEKSKEFAHAFFTEHGLKNNGNIIAIHPGASSKGRQMPPVFYTQLINRLIENGYDNIILCYSEYDIKYIMEVNKGLIKTPLEVHTKHISELAAIFKLCKIAVVHNSGPRHLAAAVGINTLAILQDYDDIMWKIYYNDPKHEIIQANSPCENCSSAGQCYGYIPAGDKYGARCMNSINPEDVYSRVVSLLNNN